MDSLRQHIADSTGFQREVSKLLYGQFLERFEKQRKAGYYPRALQRPNAPLDCVGSLSYVTGYLMEYVDNLLDAVQEARELIKYSREAPPKFLDLFHPVFEFVEYTFDE